MRAIHTSNLAAVWLMLTIGQMMAPEGRAIDLNIPTLSEIVRDSDKVARIRINARRDASLRHGAENYHCGSVYSAQVVESLKGGDEDFTFVSAAEQDFSGFDVEYLVFLLEAKSLALPANETLSGEVLCRVEAAPYVTIDQLQMMIPFRRSDEANGSGDSLRISRISAVSVLPVREVAVDGVRFGLVEWEAAKAAIENEITGQKNATSESRKMPPGCPEE